MLSAMKGREMGRKTLTTAVAVAAVVGLIATSAFAAGIVYDDVPFTQAELDTNWVIDRSVPSGGYESVSFDGRDDVLEIRVDPENRNEPPNGSTFFYTEGLLRQTPGAAALKADLYVDPSWEGQDVRAGLWGVGHVSGDRNDAFPIIEYHQAGTESGWRVWDSVTGWLPHPGTTSYGEWATVEVVLDADNDEFVVSVDGVSMTLPGLGTETLGEAIVNTFNYGSGTPAYDVHYSNFAIGAPGPDSKDECKNGGYTDFGFKNQGHCVSFVNAND